MMNLEAGARIMYQQRPQHTDPAHWETPWDEVPEAWKAGQRKAAKSVIAAAAPLIRADERRRISAEIQASDLGSPVKLNLRSGTAHFLTGPDMRELFCAFITERSGE